MLNWRKSVKLTLALTYFFMILLLCLVITLPMLVTWYVEIKGKDPNLPTVVMLACYPCVPFAAVILTSIRRISLNALSGLVFGDSNLSALKRISICGAAVGVICFAAGFYYLPFFLVSAVSGFCSLSVKAIKDVFALELQRQREKIFEEMRKEYEK